MKKHRSSQFLAICTAAVLALSVPAWASQVSITPLDTGNTTSSKSQSGASEPSTAQNTSGQTVDISSITKPTVASQGAVLLNAADGSVLFSKNGDTTYYPASITKLMTALVAVESHPDLSEVVTIRPEWTGVEGSSMYLKVGEKLTLETLLYGLLLCSGNDAAVAIAEHISGSQEDFAKLMNATAREIGMEHSSFANPNGLDHEDHYSTARDMARLACAAVENETLVRMASTRSVTIGGRTMTNHNKLLNQIEGCIGLKTGYTMAAGRTLVSCVERNGQRLVAVTLQDGNDWADHAALYDYGFSTYPAKLGASLGQTIQRVQVENGMSATVPLVAADSFAWPLAEGESLELDVELAGSLRAPIRAGRRAGEAVFSVNGKEVGRVALLYGADVAPRMESALSILKQGLPG